MTETNMKALVTCLLLVAPSPAEVLHQGGHALKDRDSSDCIDQLPADNKCTWTCSKLASYGYCTSDFSDLKSCFPRSKGLLKDYCRWSCLNCGCKNEDGSRGDGTKQGTCPTERCCTSDGWCRKGPGIIVTSDNCKINLHVRRGRDWPYGDEDHQYGKPMIGVITTCSGDGFATVKWEIGLIASYRMGYENKYELYFWDTCTAPASVTPSTAPGPYSGTYVQELNKYCKDGYSSMSYNSVSEAQSACNHDRDCGIVYDGGCTNKNVMTCDKSATVSTSSQGSCIYRKFGGCNDRDKTHGKKDTYGNGCSWYTTRYNYVAFCGKRDTIDFIASKDCCACGGGIDDTSTAPASVTPSTAPTTSRPGMRFFLADAGKLCCDHSAEVVNKDQCRHSIGTIKGEYPDVLDNIDYNHEWHERPNGCFLHLGNKNVHWNSHGAGSRNNDDRQVCEVKDWKEQGFFLGCAGKLCSDYSSQSLVNEAECKTFLPKVLPMYPDAKDGTWYKHSWDNRPKGCFLHLNNFNLHWNSHSTGQRNNDDRELCTRADVINDAIYEKVAAGSLCSDKRSEVTTEVECKKAAERLGLSWGAAWNGPNDFPECFLAEDWRNKVYFNLSPNPKRTNVYSKYAAICYKE